MTSIAPATERIRHRIAPAGPKEEIDALTGIRGVAACLVIAYHVYPSEQFPWGLHQLVARGYLAVDIFFVLSGFVMALNYGRMFHDGPTVRGTLIFLMRRVAQLYPLLHGLPRGACGLFFRRLWRVVAVPRCWLAGMNQEHPVKDLIANSLMIQSWGISRAITADPTWSISTGGSYFLFPPDAGTDFVSPLALGARRGADRRWARPTGRLPHAA